MNILIVNDDGINALGIEILTKAASQFGICYVAAPLYEQSAKSASITIKGPVIIKDNFKISYAHKAIAIDGSPSDAVRAGLKFFEVDFDLVLSGINNGVNIASDIQYSGTVAAAFEAAIFGVPGIAFSAHDINLEYVFDETVKLLDEIINYQLYLETDILNINYPHRSILKPKGVKITKQGKRLQVTSFKPHTKKDHYHLTYSTINYLEHENSDYNAFNDGFVSITPLKIDRTDHKKFDKIFKKD